MKIRAVLDPWLGEPKRKRNEGRVVLIYRFNSEGLPSTPLRLKVEINTREHFSILGYIKKQLTISNNWFSGSAEITCFQLEELLATKLRALYQRKKGRDLYDLYICYKTHPKLDFAKIYNCFIQYMNKENFHITRAQFEENIYKKLAIDLFVNDIKPLLQSDISESFDIINAKSFIEEHLFPLFPGDSWKKPENDKPS